MRGNELATMCDACMPIANGRLRCRPFGLGALFMNYFPIQALTCSDRHRRNETHNSDTHEKPHGIQITTFHRIFIRNNQLPTIPPAHSFPAC